MTSLTHFAHHTPWEGRSEFAPHALPFVLRYDKGGHFTEAEVLQAATTHMLTLLKNVRVQDPSTLWGERWSIWESQQFRKLAKRTTPAKFDAIVKSKSPNLIVSHTQVGDGRTVSFLSVPPYAVDNPDRRVAPFPVSGLQLPSGELRGVNTEKGRQLVLSVNRDLDASTGKLIAQVAHAVQLGVYASSAEALQEWEMVGASVAFARHLADPFVAVRDAGFTEVPAGSETVAVAWS